MGKKDIIISALKDANKGQQKIIDSCLYDIIDLKERIVKLKQNVDILERFVLRVSKPFIN